MTRLLVALLFALDIGFVLGCLWNGRVYERGYRDAQEISERK